MALTLFFLEETIVKIIDGMYMPVAFQVVTDSWVVDIKSPSQNSFFITLQIQDYNLSYILFGEFEVHIMN